MFFLTFFTFIIIIGGLIFFHELFHFIAAKRNKVLVEEFCIGFPPRIFSKKWKETIYSIGAIPIGGFVKLFGEETRETSLHSFYGKSIGKRAKIVAAGVMANFLIAAILFITIFAKGAPEVIGKDIPKNAKDVFLQIINVNKDSPAEKSGLKIGDKILELKVNQKIITPRTGEEIESFVEKNKGEIISLKIKRGKKIIEKKVLARKNPPKDEGPMGIVLERVAIVAYPLPEAILKGLRQTIVLTFIFFEFLFKVLKGVILKEPIPQVEIVGPIGIGGLLSHFIELGWLYILQFTAVLSLNLAILNILPFPALDGGRLLFLLIEKIRKKPIKKETENLINQIGLALLLTLMVIITIRDISKIF